MENKIHWITDKFIVILRDCPCAIICIFTGVLLMMFIPMYGGWVDTARVLLRLQLCLQWELESQTGTQTLRPHLLLSAFTSHQCDQGSPAHTLVTLAMSRVILHSRVNHVTSHGWHYNILVYSCLCCPYCKLAHQLCWVTLSLQSAGEMCCVVTHNVDVGVATRSTRGNICLSLNQYICDRGAQIGPNID